MDYESLIIGHVTMDVNTDFDGTTVNMPGGAVLFSSASAYALGHKTTVLTKAKRDDRDRIKAIVLPEKDVICLDAEKNTDMVNVYYTADRERRKSVCACQGDAFRRSDIPENVTAQIYHLAGLTYGDYEDGMIEFLAKKGKVAVDVQGFLRHVDRADEGKMHLEDWTDKKKLLPFITFLKTDAAEAEMLTGETDREKAAKMLYSWGAKEILITHNTEVLVFDGEKTYTCPIKARNLSGRTGRGDTTFAAYINERLTKNIPSALEIATATVSLKMEKPGVFDGTRSDVEKYIAEFYRA